MSLLNQALRDLQERQQSQQAAAPVMPGLAMSRSPLKSPWPRRLLLGLLAAILIALLLILLRWPQALHSGALPPEARPTETRQPAATPPVVAPVITPAPVALAAHEAAAPETAAGPEMGVEPEMAVESEMTVEPEALVERERPLVREAPDLQQAAEPEAFFAPAPLPEQVVALSEVIPSAMPVSVKSTSATPATRDRQLAQSLSAQLAAGQLDTAWQTAQAQVDGSQDWPRTRALLASWWLTQQDPQKALDWLPARALTDQPNLRLLAARAALAKGDSLGPVIARLSASLPALEAEPDYYVTLASLLQQQGEAARSAQIWGELLKFDNSRADWWMGLGIALDTSQRKQDARSAYQQALRLPGLQAALADYARQQLTK